LLFCIIDGVQILGAEEKNIWIEREEIRGEWKELFTEAMRSLMILHFSRNIVKMKRAGHVPSSRGNINTQKFLTRRPEGRKPPGRPSRALRMI
jgi:hypothetical protein